MTTSTDVIAKLQTDLLKILPTTAVERTTIQVIAGILTAVADELGPVLEKKIDTAKLWEGLANIESGMAQAAQGTEQVYTAMKGPAMKEPVFGQDTPIATDEANHEAPAEGNDHA